MPKDTQLLNGRTRIRIWQPGSLVHVLVTVLCHTTWPTVCLGPEDANTAGGLRDGLAVTGLLPALLQACTQMMAR